MAFESPKSVVQDYRAKILKLKVTDVNEINLIIDQLNARHDFNFSTENEAYVTVLLNLSKLIAPKNDHLLSKFCCLLYFSVHKQKITFEKKSVEYFVQFLIPVIQSCADWVQCDALMALSAIIDENADLMKGYYDGLIGRNGVLMKILADESFPPSVQYNAFQCLLSIVANVRENAPPVVCELLDFCYQKCLLTLKEKLMCTTELIVLKIMVTSLKCLQNILGSRNLAIKNHGELLGIIKNLLFYGLPGPPFTFDINLYPTLRCPDAGSAHFESQSESDSPYPKLRKQKKNKRRLKKASHRKKGSDSQSGERDDDCPTDEIENGVATMSLSTPSKTFYDTKIRSSSSDSELSDAESHLSKIKSLQASVRQHAYVTLQAAVKVLDKKVMFGYWSSFLPENPNIPGLPPSQTLFTTILKDPSPQVRLCALALLAELLSGSKQFLAHAEEQNTRQLSFTSLSSILATMINEIHRYLFLALFAENSSQLLIQILKCCSILSGNVPYSKLNKDILFKLLKHLKEYLCHKDIQIQVACLAVYDSIVSSTETPAEIGNLLLVNDFEKALSEIKSSSQSSSTENEQSSWIIELCKDNVFNDEPLPIKIQSLQLLSSLSGKFFMKLRPFFPVIDDVVLFCLNHNDTTIQLHGAKLLDILGRSLNINNETDKSELQSSMSQLWKKVLMGPLINSITNDEMKTLQTICCDCLSTLTDQHFEEMPQKQQIVYVTILLGLATDTNPNVRGAAIRCLGLYCLFPSLNQDVSFLDDVSVILIKSVKDPNFNVRLKASWSVGNLSSAFSLNRHELLLNQEVSPKFFCSIGMACVEFAADNDRIKANAVRALGNLLNYIPQKFIESSSIQELIRKSTHVLMDALAASFTKVCWNSCYALRNMFKNAYLMDHGFLNLEALFQGLFMTLRSPNFKVRISAVQALTALTCRAHYGSLFVVVWQNLLESLSTTSSDVNFKEMKHQENLCDQLCFGICELVLLITMDDILLISKDLLDARETLLTSMWKFGTRMTEEKSLLVRSAIERLNSLKEESPGFQSDLTIAVIHDVLNEATTS